MSLLVLFVIYFSLLVWAARRIFQSNLPNSQRMLWFILCILVPFLGVGIYAAYKEQYITGKELFSIVFAIVLFGFLFSFKNWGVDTFSVSTGISNWTSACGAALITWTVHLLSQKLMARHFKAQTIFKLWIPGIVISLVLIFLTNGWFIWAAIGCTLVISKFTLRPGRKTEEEVAGPYEISLIIAAGIFASTILAAVGKLLIPTLGNTAKNIMHMNLWLAVFSVIPLFLIKLYPALKMGQRVFEKWTARRASYVRALEIPEHKRSPSWILLHRTYEEIGKSAGLSEGEWLFFGSRRLWLFTAIFVVVTALTIIFLNPLVSLFIALISAITIWLIVAWYHKDF